MDAEMWHHQATAAMVVAPQPVTAADLDAMNPMGRSTYADAVRAALRAQCVSSPVHDATATAVDRALESALLEPPGARTILALSAPYTAGKSTLIKLMAQQQPVARGAIHFDQRPLSDWGHREFARQVAYLPQHLPSAESLTGRELVGFGRYPWHGLLGRHTQADEEAVERAIALTHTEAFADRLVDTLSGGERQRVAIARALSNRPKLVLADEPTGNLDEKIGQEIIEILAKLNADQKMTMVLVTHNPLVADRTRRQFRLGSGKLIEETVKP